MNASLLPSGRFRSLLESGSGDALLITRNNLALADVLREAGPGHAWTVVTKNDLRGWNERRLLRLLRSRGWTLIVVEDREDEATRRADLYRLLLLLGRARHRWILASREDAVEARQVSSRAPILAAGGILAADALATAGALLRAWRLDRRLARMPSPGAREPGSVSSRRVAVLKTEFWFNVKAGGSVSHALGVLHGLQKLGLEPHLWSTSELPGLRPGIGQTLVLPEPRPALIEEAAMAAFNRTFLDVVEEQVRAFDPAIVYHRHGVFSVAGLALARRLGVPLVLEVNASEVWAREAWSRLYFAPLARRMERTVLSQADRLVLISGALIPTIGSLGGDPERMVVNPNGVDVGRFRPGERGGDLRARLGFADDDVVCGFTGTFHTWHGVLFLAERIRPLLDADARLRFLLVGDGDRLPDVQRIVRETGAESRVRFTGLLPPDAIPPHLAACDILLSPHLPFEDGTEFFGSPTKLFEYLAAGRPVVASRLGQIGDIVEDGETGLLVPPGDGERFDAAVLRLARDAGERKRLGARGREAAERRYTWDANARRAVEGLVDLP